MKLHGGSHSSKVELRNVDAEVVDVDARHNGARHQSSVSSELSRRPGLGRFAADEDIGCLDGTA